MRKLVGFNDVEEFDYGCSLVEVKAMVAVLNNGSLRSRDKMLILFSLGNRVLFFNGSLTITRIRSCNVGGNRSISWCLKWGYIGYYVHWTLINFDLLLFFSRVLQFRELRGSFRSCWKFLWYRFDSWMFLVLLWCYFRYFYALRWII